MSAFLDIYNRWQNLVDIFVPQADEFVGLPEEARAQLTARAGTEGDYDAYISPAQAEGTSPGQYAVGAVGIGLSAAGYGCGYNFRPAQSEMIVVSYQDTADADLDTTTDVDANTPDTGELPETPDAEIQDQSDGTDSTETTPDVDAQTEISPDVQIDTDAEPEILLDIDADISDEDTSDAETIDAGPTCTDTPYQNCTVPNNKLKDVCLLGIQYCTGYSGIFPVWDQCTTKPEHIKEEVCDGVDNNCDGDIDNLLTPAPDADKQNGICKDSKKICSGISGFEEPDYTLIPDFGKELCDNLDNDCDGMTDNVAGGAEPISQGCKPNPQLDCSNGKEVCADGKWSGVCEIPPSIVEICDGIDNDCDGKTDNDKAGLFANLSDSCETEDKGECKGLGEYECAPDKTKTICNAESKPAKEEVCDGKDNDCNGVTDDALKQNPANLQNGVCAGAAKECAGVNGWVEPDYKKISSKYEASEISCDGKDNDCDGKTDNNLSAPPADLQAGVCAGSAKVCAGLNGWKNNYAAILGYNTAELCDGADNDCNGTTDETFALLNTICKVGLGLCANEGKYVCDINDSTKSKCSVEPLPKQNETCNAQDDDCDGVTDNNTSDKDLDNICDELDNCPIVKNADQKNSDLDPNGDACTPVCTPVSNTIIINKGENAAVEYMISGAQQIVCGADLNKQLSDPLTPEKAGFTVSPDATTVYNNCEANGFGLTTKCPDVTVKIKANPPTIAQLISPQGIAIFPSGNKCFTAQNNLNFSFKASSPEGKPLVCTVKVYEGSTKVAESAATLPAADTLNLNIGANQLKPRTKYTWDVTVTDEYGQSVTSEKLSFTTSEVGLAMWFNFDEGQGAEAKDISGNGVIAKFYKGTAPAVPTWIADEDGSGAVALNGTDEHFSIMPPPWASITYSALNVRFKKGSKNTQQLVVNIYGPGVQDLFTEGLALYLAPTSQKIGFYFPSIAAEKVGVNSNITTTWSAQPNTWYTAKAIYDSSAKKAELFVGGTKQGEFTSQHLDKMNFGPYPFEFGSFSGASKSYLNGAIGEFTAYTADPTVVCK